MNVGNQESVVACGQQASEGAEPCKLAEASQRRAPPASAQTLEGGRLFFPRKRGGGASTPSESAHPA
eukprot:11205631-Alexandrium_andersonii.AAC.1